MTPAVLTWMACLPAGKRHHGAFGVWEGVARRLEVLAMTKPKGDTPNAAGLRDADKPESRVVPLFARRSPPRKQALPCDGAGNDDDPGPSAA